MADFKISTPPNFSNSLRNTIVLNGSNNFSSLRIEDPKKVNKLSSENDVCLKTMINQIPQVNQYFNITEKLGEGTFSKVYKAKLKRQFRSNDDEESDEFALKYIIPIVKPARIAKELRFLRDLGGLANIIPIKACFYNSGHTVIVMPIIEHDKFLDYLQLMDISEVRDYMKNLLISLERVHAHGIIHRDIKPSNFLYNRSKHRYALVDFGLSQNERELYHAISYVTQQTNKSSRDKSESKARKNLNLNFVNNCSNSTIKEKAPVKMKRTYDEINEDKNDENINCENSDGESSKRTKYFAEKTSSVFISPITPSVSKENNIIVPATPVKMRTPLSEDTNIILNTPIKAIPCTPVKNSIVYATPTKTLSVQTDANKTPVKANLAIPETPPKTVQKNLQFCKQTFQASQPRKENVQNYSTPKVTRPNFQRLNSKKILHPELSNVAGSNASSKSSVDSSRTFGCDCLENSTVCFSCLAKPELNVPRAGTPGFRAPEILLRCQNQSTKIDIWSSGVIFASLLSGRYPFFRCIDDMTCLAEIITVIGSSKVKKAAAALGKTLVISQKRPSMDLGEVCSKLRDSMQKSSTNSEIIKDFRAPASAYDLLGHLLDPNPFTRFSASEALSHPFFMDPLPSDLI